jgi:hypothetical protein
VRDTLLEVDPFGADIFLADVTGRYLGRICQRECHPRVACLAQHCGRREHLNDDLHVVTLSKEIIFGLERGRHVIDRPGAHAGKRRHDDPIANRRGPACADPTDEH